MALAPQVRLANDVAAQFRHLPHDEAVAAVAAHLRTFWEPRMRTQLVEAADAGAGDLDPIAAEAAGTLRPNPHAP
jgi:formate dehydrogenase subunit delta